MSAGVMSASVWAARAASSAMAAALAMVLAATPGAAIAASDRAAALQPPSLISAPFPRPRPARLTRVEPYRSAARNVIILELDGGEVLFERRADRAAPPASLTKLMTLYVALEAVAAGEIALDDPVPVSARAASRRGSSMFLQEGDRPSLRALLTGLIVLSGNDAAVAVAEGVAGSIPAFVARMNAAAEALGLEASRFRNPTGLPAEGHAMSVRDVATLSARILRSHPQMRPVFALRDYRWGGVAQKNRNPVLFADLSDIRATADGLKTGYTASAGYCVAVTAMRREPGGEARRVLAVLAGLRSEAARAREAERAVRWAFAALEARR